jgi:hypothetical protein
MSRTANREHGELILPDGAVFESTGGDPPTQGGVRYDGTDFRMRDSVGVFNPRTGAAPVTDRAWRRHFLLMGA